ncbi:MAG: PAS domain-containing protein [Anaerolineales bacterium]|nr:PAS domain-containing protein [Anaerolineales bacterium]
MKKTDLRQQAEAKLSKRKKSPATDANADPLRLIHELEVHQIELEMQNEELLQANAELESTLSQYAELYAFASAGYFTLTRDGTIRRANLTAAKLMGVGLSELIQRRFAVFISPESRIPFSAFLDRVFTSSNKETCEVAIHKDGYDPLWVQIEAIVDPSGGQDGLCYAMVSEITDRKARKQ